MRAAAFVLVLVLAATGTSRAADEWTMSVPAGWVKTANDAVEGQVAQLRKLPATVGADATVYMAPDNLTQLTILQWSMNRAASTSGLEELNRGVMEGAKEQATKHISDEAHFDGAQLVADQIDEANTLRIHQHRRFAVDSGGTTHMVSAMCASASTNTSCEQAIMGLRMTVPNEVAPETHTSVDSPAYRIGQITGVVIVVLLIGLWLKTGGHLWRRPKKS